MKDRIIISYKSLLSLALFLALILAPSLASAQEGIITTVAGTGTAGFSGDGGPATSAGVREPISVDVGPDGSIYIGHLEDARVRKVNSQGIITTIAGNGTVGYSGDGGPATSAMIGNQVKAAVGPDGSVYIADTSNQRVRKVDPQGIITTIAGNGIMASSGDGGLAINASLAGPNNVTISSDGSIFIGTTGTGGHNIRKIDPQGIISTVAGNGSRSFGGDGGPATSASFNEPSAIAIGSDGSLYVADASNYRIRKVDPQGIISTVAGNGTRGNSGDGGPATSASLYWPTGVALGSDGSIFIADTWMSHRIRRVDPQGIITTVAGGGAGCTITQNSGDFSGDGGPAISACFDFPQGIDIDSGGRLFVADYRNHRVRRITFGQATTGTITGTVSNASTSAAISGATVSTTSGGYYTTTDSSGNYTISNVSAATYTVVASADGYSSASQANVSVTAGATATVNLSLLQAFITTVAGSGAGSTGSRYAAGGYSGDGGQATQAQLNFPVGVEVDSAANLYIADSENNRIRKVDASGIITTVAGTGSRGFSGDGGPATQAQLSVPIGVSVDSAGNLYIADNLSNRFRKVDTSGIITTIAGTGTAGFSGDGGLATQAQFNGPYGPALDSLGNLYIAEPSNNRVRKVDTSGIITTVAGSGPTGYGTGGYGGDGGLATQAQLNNPMGVSVDSAANLYIADYSNHRVRKVDTSGIITTVTGTGTTGYSGDSGPATQAQLYYPHSIAVDTTGNLYITDNYNHRVRRVDASGIITTVAGSGPTGVDSGGYSGDGGPATQARFSKPYGVAVDNAGNLYIGDGWNQRVRKVTFGQATTGTIAGTITNSSTGSGISGATVSTSTGGYSATTGSNGTYTISNVATGTYIVTASASGYQSNSQANVSVTAGATATVSIQLTPTVTTTTGTISGTITNALTGAVLSGATVSTSTGGFSTTSGSNGAYTLSNVSAGTYTVNVSASGYQSASQANVSVTAGGTTAQNISLTPLPAISLSPASLSFSGQQGGSNPSSQTITITNSGSGTLSWNASDNADWLSLSQTSGSVSAGQSSTLTASVNISGLSVGQRSATITVSSTNATNSPQTVSVTLNITAQPPPSLVSISVSPAAATLTSAGATQQLTATGTYSNNTTQNVASQATWTSSNASVATVSASGVVTAVANGQATITASLSGRSATSAVTVNISVTVPTPSAQVVSISVAPSSLSLTSAGQTAQLQATATLASGASQDVTTSATWTSSNPSVALVSSGGLVTAATSGTATITATYGGSSGSATISVSITAPGQDLVTIEVEPSSVNITVRGSWPLRAMGHYRDGSERDLTTSVSWSSSNNLIATVSSSGTVTGANIGMTSITARSGSISGSAFVTVGLSPPHHISIMPREATLRAAGETADFSAFGYSADGSQQYPVTDSVQWTSSDSSVVTVSAGRVTAVGPGRATITARLNELTATATVQVVINRAPVIVRMEAQEAIVGRAFSYSVPATDPDGDALSYSLIMGAPRGMTIDVLTGIISWTPEASQAGASGVFVEVEDGSGGRAESFLTIRVSFGAPAISSFSPATGPAGTLVTITGENFLPTPSQNTVTFNGFPAIITSATATSLSARVPGDATTGIIAVTTPGGTANSIEPFRVEISPISITASPQEITLSRPGQTVQISVQGNFSEGSSRDVTGSSTFSSSDPTVAQVIETGLVSYVRNGSAAIEVANGELSAQVAVTVDIRIPVAGTARVRPQLLAAGFDPTIIDRGDDSFGVIALVRPGAAPIRAVTINQNESEFSIRMGHSYTIENGDQLWRTTYNFNRGAFGDTTFRALWGDQPGEFNITVIDEGQGRHSFPDLEFGNTPSPPGEVTSPMAEPEMGRGIKRLRPQVLTAGFSPAIIDLGDDHFDILALVREGAVPIRAVTLTQNQGTFRFGMERDLELPNGDQLWRATFNYQRGLIQAQTLRALWGDQPGEFNISVVDEAQARHSFPDLEFGYNPALGEEVQRPAPPAPEAPSGGQMTAAINGERLTSTALTIAADSLIIYIQGVFPEGSILRLAIVRRMVEGAELPLTLRGNAFGSIATFFVDIDGVRHEILADDPANTLNIITFGSPGEEAAGMFRVNFEGDVTITGDFSGIRGQDGTLPPL